MTPTAPGDYSATLCDERHDRIDETLRTIGGTLGTISTGVAALQTEVALVRVRMDVEMERSARTSTGLWNLLAKLLPLFLAAALGAGAGAATGRASAPDAQESDR